MLTIICGEDTSASRSYFASLKKEYSKKGYEIRDIAYQNIESINLWSSESPSLFGDKKVFFSEKLNKYFRKDNPAFTSQLQKIAKTKEIEMVDWEDVSLWELKLKKIGSVKEFKPNQTIFKLQDALYPGNRQGFISLLESLSENMDENFIFIMLVRYVRNLIIIKEGGMPAKMQSWQTYKLKSQVSHWKTENLVNFYEALFKIEIGLKTGSNPFSIKESLEILACHFL